MVCARSGQGNFGEDVFFFSSRRRHTRCSRDWSSDVCSSDLTSLAAAGVTATDANLGGDPEPLMGPGSCTLSGTTPMNPAVLVLTPAMGLTAEGTSSTYTPGARYSGM